MEKSFVKHRIKNIFPINKIVTIHYFEFDPDFVSKSDVHDFWELVYVDKGVLIAQSGEDTITLSQGECFFHPPGEVHSHHANGRVAPNIFIISFVCSGEDMKAFASRKFTVPGNLRPIISGIISEGKNTFNLPFNDPDLKKLSLLPEEITGGQQMVRIYLEQFLIMMLRHQQTESSESKTATRITAPGHLAETIAAQLDSMVYSKTNIDEFCSEMRYSKSYLSKIFRKNFGCTMVDYITDIKVKEAKKLIRESHYNFCQVSDLLKFSSPFYFSRVFKKITGMSPSEYKKSVKID